MRKFVVTLMAALVGTSSASAFWQEALDASLEVGVGYRVDRVDWRVSNNCDSSCYSDYSYYSYGDYSNDEGFSTKQKWNDLQIWQIEAKGKYVTCDNVYLRANGDYGWIVSGKGKRETSFRAGNFSEDFASWHSHTRGHVYDAEIAIGYQFKWCDDSFAIAPLVGYSWNGQHLRNSHFTRGSSSCGDYDSYYSYGDYSYDDCGPSIVNNLRWAGPFIGFDFDYRFGFGCGCEAEWEFFGTYEFHWANLHSRQHFDRDGGYYDDYSGYGYDYYSGYSGTSRVKRHSHDAYGNLFNFGLKWDFCECWTLALKGEFQWWWASHGVERTKLYSTDYCPGPEVEVYAKRGWKGVKHDVASVSLDLGMAF